MGLAPTMSGGTTFPVRHVLLLLACTPVARRLLQTLVPSREPGGRHCRVVGCAETPSPLLLGRIARCSEEDGTVGEGRFGDRCSHERRYERGGGCMCLRWDPASFVHSQAGRGLLIRSRELRCLRSSAAAHVWSSQDLLPCPGVQETLFLEHMSSVG